MDSLTGYLTIREFAKKAGVSVQAVHKALKTKNKRIGKFSRIGHVYLIHKSEVKKYVSKRLKKSHE